MLVTQNRVTVYLEYLITQRHSKEVSCNMYLIKLILCILFYSSITEI